MASQRRNDRKSVMLQRVEELLSLAEREPRPELSERYVRLAWRIKTRHALRLPPELKRRFCRKCFSIMVPGRTCRVRIREGVLTTTCLRCGRTFRFPYKK